MNLYAQSKQLLQNALGALREATKQEPSMRPVWGVVALGAAASIVSLLRGSDEGAVWGVIFAAAGFVLIALLRALIPKPTGSRPVPPDPLHPMALSMARTVTWVFNTLMVLVLLAAISGFPCPLAKKLGFDLHSSCTLPTLALKTGVHVKRTSDFTGSKCLSDGRRYLKEVVTDSLTFEGGVNDYELIAIKTTGDTTLSISYKDEGAEATTQPGWHHLTPDVGKTSIKIPVKNGKAEVSYTWTQRPPKEDRTFTAAAIVSSLDVLSFESIVKLPPGKKIFGTSPLPEHKEALIRIDSKGCQLVATGNPSKVVCHQKIEKPGEISLPISWNVFSECEPEENSMKIPIPS
jgi:hypothetical protein